MWDESTLQMLLLGVGETLYMTLGSTLFAYVIGLPLGVLLVMCASDGIRPHPVLYKILDVVVNLTRSFPFIILLIAVHSLAARYHTRPYRSHCPPDDLCRPVCGAVGRGVSQRSRCWCD